MSAASEVRVLLVDDETADATATDLERTDDQLTVETAADAREGLDRLADTGVDCVVSAYDIPGRNGVELLRTVRDEHGQLPFILCPESESWEIVSEAISAGVTDYLPRRAVASQPEFLAERIGDAVEHGSTSPPPSSTREDAGRERPSEPAVADAPEDAGRGRSSEPAVADAPEDAGRERSSEPAVADAPEDAVEHGSTSPDSQGTAGETEEMLSAIAAKSDDVFFIFSGDWSELLFVNSAYEDIWGASVAELESEPSSFLESVHPEDRDAVTRSMERLSGGEPDELEYRVVRPDGEQRWVRAESRPMLDDDGTVTRIVGFVQDITDRKERQEELERYEAIVENTEDGIYVFDGQGRFEFVNQRVVEVSGIPRDAWIGEHISIHTDLGTLTEAEVGAIEGAIEAVARGEQEEARVEVNPDVPHDLRDLELRMTPLRAEGEDNRVIAFSRDVTEQRERERELKRQNERVDEFASVVSHDLRNPLNVADLRLELAREECDSEHLDDVAGALDRMETLIDDLLTLARVEKEIDEKEPVDLAVLGKRCWGTVETQEATLALETGRTIRADRTRLQQLLENLVRNAVEHGGSDVTVTIGDLDGGFFVADDGSGIPPEERETVFESGQTRKENGTGFGLSIVRDIAEAHGWVVDVTESREGGARFEITGVETVE